MNNENRPINDFMKEIHEKNKTLISEFYKNQDIQFKNTEAILICFSSQGIFDCREKFNHLPIMADAMFEFSIQFNEIMHEIATLLYWDSHDKGCLGINAVNVARKLNLFTPLELDHLEGKTTSLYIYLSKASKEMVQTLIFFKFFSQRQFIISEDMMKKIPAESRKEAMLSMINFTDDTNVLHRILDYLCIKDDYMWYFSPTKIEAYDFNEEIRKDNTLFKFQYPNEEE